MFAVEIPVIPFCARFSGWAGLSHRMSDRRMASSANIRSPQELINAALAEMVPSTGEEIAEATGLDSVTATAHLDRMSACCKVMFNPLTKRYSLPKAPPLPFVAA